MELPTSWQEAAARIAASPQARLVYVLGETASGKSTLCRYLGGELRRGFRTAYVDCDPGQSVVGPPGSLGLLLYASAGTPPKGERSWLRFVGATSPESHLLETAAGIRRLLDKALESGAQKVLLDSSGFLAGQQGRLFQVSLIELLQPQLLLALQGGPALERVLAVFRRHPAVQTIPLAVAASAAQKSPAQRRQYRQERFARYFSGAVESQLSLRGLALQGDLPNLREPERFRNLLCAPCDAEGYALCLGILRELDATGARVRLRSPPFAPADVASFCFGSLRLEESGLEL
jgi:polynucleotide 5'-hydroxyl-kinase GRC3/NOL9